MYTAVLLTDPTRASLDNSLVDNLRNAWGGGGVLWLSPGAAAEFSMPEKPENLWDVWKSLQAMEIDLVVVPSVGRKKKLLLADMDSTMIQQECIDELADVAGVGPKVAEITAKAMNGELDFEAALDERVATLCGQKTSLIDTVIQERITFTPGGKTLISTMKSDGARAVLVSGGFTDFTGFVAKELGFDEHHANRLIAEGGHFTGTVERPILGRQAKVETLEKASIGLGISPHQAIAVGDGANDLGMLNLAGFGVALHAKPTVAEQSDIRINFGDLTALLFVQGYAKDEFVS